MFIPILGRLIGTEPSKSSRPVCLSFMQDSHLKHLDGQILLGEGSSQFSVLTISCCSVVVEKLTFTTENFLIEHRCPNQEEGLQGPIFGESTLYFLHKTEVPVHPRIAAPPNGRSLLLVIGFNQGRIFFGMLISSLLS